MQVEQTNNLLDTLKNRNSGPAEGTMAVANYIQKNSQTAEGASGVKYQKSEEELGIFAAGSANSAVYGKPGAKEEKTIAEQVESAPGLSAEQHRNEMAVISNTTSPEDFQKMEEDGFTPSEMNSKTIVTVTDKIKAVMAKAGEEVVGDVSKEALEEMTGSVVLSQQIIASLESQDLPATTENVEDEKKAYEQITGLGGLDSAAMAYLLKNNLEPTIANIYMAAHSGMSGAAAVESGIDFSEMEEQIRSIIEHSGFAADAETVADAEWMIGNQVPLTSENIHALKELKHISLELSGAAAGEEGAVTFSRKVLEAMTTAIAEGRRPEDAVLAESYSLRALAQDAADTIVNATDEDVLYVLSQGQELTVGNLDRAMRARENGGAAAGQTAVTTVDAAFLTARRQLEEVRLAMTTEANYALLKKGMEIDTKPLAQLVEDLKAQEDMYYRSLLSDNGVEATDENVRIFADTTQLLSETKFQPAYALTLGSDQETIPAIHEAGAALKESFEKANERYETMMTAPRADMGDSIQKAFQNVDDILRDLDMDITEASRRAVRILAYNNVELSAENIAQMKAVDENVQRAFKNLTPAVTLEMIRRNENPLDMSVTELNQKAEEIRKELGTQDVERFSKYLYKLEQKKEITEEERNSYIGIYRLIAQVEKTDGAAIGFLMQQGADVTMRNLLTAVRSSRKSGMDYEINDEFDGVNAKAAGPRIDDQILSAFQQNCMKDAMDEIAPEKLMQLDIEELLDMTPEQLADALMRMPKEKETETAYAKEQLSQYAEVLTAPEEVYSYLGRYDVPDSVVNVIAASRMLKNPKQMFDDLWKGASEETVEGLKEEVLKRFGEALKNPEELADAQEALAERAEHAMEGMIIEDPSVRSVDISGMKILGRQFTLAAKASTEESYVIPMQTGDEITGVSLKVVRGKKEKGLVDIIFDSDSLGKVSASFEAKDGGIAGTIITDRAETREKLMQQIEALTDGIRENEEENVDIHIIQNKGFLLEQQQAVSLERESRMERGDAEEQRGNTVQTRRLYNIAEQFLTVVRAG